MKLYSEEQYKHIFSPKQKTNHKESIRVEILCHT